MSTALAPEVGALLERFRALDLPPFDTLTPDEARAVRRKAASLVTVEPPELGGSVEDRVLETEAGPLRTRRYDPSAEPAPGTLVYFHGGGWVMGDLDTHDALCRHLALATGLRVTAVAYRLAPEHPHPAALEDAWAATVATAAEEEGWLVVGGDSAGGHLATCVAARARGGGVRVDAQLLLYPVTDLSSMDTRSYAAFAEGYWLTRKGMAWFRDHYVPEGHDLRDPDVSPLHRTDLAGMPPAVIATAEFDVLRDEGEAYADRLAHAGTRVAYRCFEGVIHGFLALPGVLPQSVPAIRETGEALRRVLEEEA